LVSEIAYFKNIFEDFGHLSKICRLIRVYFGDIWRAAVTVIFRFILWLVLMKNIKWS
jgi:hypothetical protein